jgi:phosphatidylglycerol:prolipoprotein diacylglycerol transferase
MFPYITFLGRSFAMYQIMSLCGIFGLGTYTYYAAKKVKYNEGDIVIFLLIAGTGVFLGGHIFYGIIKFKTIIYTIKNIKSFNSFHSIFDQLFIIFGGSIFYGGLIGGIITAYFFLDKKRTDFFYLTNLVAPAIPLFHFFGRIGCFLSGCCFGIKSTFGFIYTHSLIKEANMVKRFPVQLLEALTNLIIFLFLMKLKKYSFVKRKLFYMYLLLYSTARFFLEYLRGDSYRGSFFIFSTSQWISIIIFVFCFFEFIKFFISSENIIQHNRRKNK